jgi:hypothetical protein
MNTGGMAMNMGGMVMRTGGMNMGGVPSADTSQFNFESDTQGWVDTHGRGSTVALVSSPAFSGGKALEVSFSSTGAMDDKFIGIRNPTFTIPAGAIIKFRVWNASEVPIQGVQPYVMLWNPDLGMHEWYGNYVYKDQILRDRWMEITLSFPNSTDQLFEFGVQWQFATAHTGKVYVDAVDW